MDRFEEKRRAKVAEIRETRDRIIARRRGSESSELYDEDELTRVIEAGLSPEQWKERVTLCEYDPVSLKIIKREPELGVNDRDVTNDISYSLQQVRTIKRGYLRKEHISYLNPGNEGGTEHVILGMIDKKFCLVGDDDTRIIITPPFNSLLHVSPNYIDVQYQDKRLRISKGSYTFTDNRPQTSRKEDFEEAKDLPACFDGSMSIRVSALEVDKSAIIVRQNEFVAPIEVEYPSEEADISFENIQKHVFDYLQLQRPMPELVEQLRSVDKGIHLPSVRLDTQSYALSVRTSESADVLFFHNTTTLTRKDRVAKAASTMSIPEYLELGLDDARNRQFVGETLAETGFYFIRQHDGQLFIMDRSMDSSSVITTDHPYFMGMLDRVEDRLAEYFAALEEQAVNSQPLRETRLEIADEIEERIPIRYRVDKSPQEKAIHWLICTQLVCKH